MNKEQQPIKDYEIITNVQKYRALGFTYAKIASLMGYKTSALYLAYRRALIRTNKLYDPTYMDNKKGR